MSESQLSQHPCADASAPPAHPSGFPSGFRRAWLLPAFVAACWALAIRHLDADWTHVEQYHFGWLVPLLALYLFKVRFEQCPPPGAAPRGITTWAGLLVLAFLSMLAMPLQVSNPDWRFMGWCLSGLAAAATLLGFWQAGGSKWAAHFAFPILFFFIAVPIPARIEDPAMQWLMQHNAQLAIEMLHWLGVSGQARGNLIMLPACTLGVDEACSGIRSLQGTLMLTLFVGEIFAFRWPRRLLLLAAGFGWALLTNVLRTVALALIAARSGLPAVDRWHDTAGLSVLAICAAGVAGTAWVMQRFTRRPPPGPALPAIDFAVVARRLARAAWPGGVVLAMLAAGLVLTEVWFRTRERAMTLAPEWTFRMPEDRPSFRKLEIPRATRAILQYSDASSGKWEDEAGHRWHALFFLWRPPTDIDQTDFGHDPRSCLAAVGMKLVAVLPRVVIARDGLRLPFDAYHFLDGTQDLFVFNCVVDDLLRPNGESRTRADNSAPARLAATLAGNRPVKSAGQRRLEIAIWGAADGAAATEMFRSMAGAQLETRPNLRARK